MTKKTSAFIFVAGAVAGWTIAQRVAGEAQDLPWAGAAPMAAPPIAPGTDPFRGAFREAAAEVELHDTPGTAWEAA